MINFNYCIKSHFFFQAEDGIRDHCVTGVQTCALPISHVRQLADHEQVVLAEHEPPVHDSAAERSEERRVGKECITRWSDKHKQNKLYIRHNAMNTYTKKMKCIYDMYRNIEVYIL